MLFGAVAHSLAGLAVNVSSLPLEIKMILSIAILIALLGFGYSYGYASGRAFIASLELLDGRWLISTGNHRTYRAYLVSGHAHPLMVILNFRLLNGARHSLILLADTAHSNDLRRLRVWLNTQYIGDLPE